MYTSCFLVYSAASVSQSWIPRRGIAFRIEIKIRSSRNPDRVFLHANVDSLIMPNKTKITAR